MKKLNGIILMLGILLLLVSHNANAQETEVIEEEKESPFTAGVDLVSTYVWRGTMLGGTSLQPLVEYSVGGFTAGGWGSFDMSNAAGWTEADLYISYGFDFGLSLGVTDYYFHEAGSWLEFSDSISSHAIEINAGYKYKGLSLGVNYTLNNSELAAGTKAGTTYFELGYSFKNVNLFIGAGDGWHTSTTEFEVCNIGLSVNKELKFSDKFSLPVSGLISMNPQREIFHVVGAISF